MTSDTTQTLRAESTRAIMVSIAMKQAAFFALFCMLATSCQAPDTGDETDFRGLRWAVVDSNDDFVGWLTSPDSNAIPDHNDIFGQWAGDVYATRSGLDAADSGEFGLGVIDTGITTGAISGPVRYTKANCMGHAHGWIATYNNGGPIPAPHCTEQQLAALSGLGQIVWHYLTEFKFDTTMDNQWPTAVGQVVQSSTGGFYLIPRDQVWGEMMITKSVAGPNGSCVNLITDAYGCSVRLLNAPGWTPLSAPPYSLVELEYAP